MSSPTASLPSATFSITACPEKPLAFTNYVYISPQSSPFLQTKNKDENWVLINGYVFNVEGHPKINPGEIGLSSVQRKTLGLGPAEKISVQRFEPVKDGSSNLVSMDIFLELLGGGRKSLKEDEVVDHLHDVYASQVLTKGQIIVTDYSGTPLQITVKELQAPIGRSKAHSDDDTGKITEYTSRGILMKTTNITVTPEENKFLRWEKSNKKKNVIIDANWSFEKMNIGGLDAQFNTLFRRAFASRIFPQKVIEELGIKHVKGILLFGPPGTGKTLIARQIGKMLSTREPKIVNGPEILNKFVGASEENIRKLFADAEVDYKQNGENADLHIIIFDEIDSICKARGTRGGDAGVGDTVVNQLLSKIDGVDSLNNILVIGMTNRKDLIDPALLRPGRLEVHIEIALPDEKGRRQIFNIHTASMRAAGRLGKDVDLDYLAAVTKNCSGAEIEAIVKSASSFALYKSIDVTKGDQVSVGAGEKIIVGMEAFRYALEEVKPAFGVDEDEIKSYIFGDLLNYGPVFEDIMQSGKLPVEVVRRSPSVRLQSTLFYGPSGAGKTSIAAKLALDSGFPYVKIVSPPQFVGIGEAQKIREISKVFDDAYKSPLSLIVVDNIDRLIEYVPVGPRFSANLLQTLLVLCSNPPPSGKKLVVLATSSNMRMIEELGFHDVFMTEIEVPALEQPEQVENVLELSQVEVAGGSAEVKAIANSCVGGDGGVLADSIPIKKLLSVIDTVRLGGAFTLSAFKEALRRANKVQQYR